jgi:hypothetical protein
MKLGTLMLLLYQPFYDEASEEGFIRNVSALDPTPPLRSAAIEDIARTASRDGEWVEKPMPFRHSRLTIDRHASHGEIEDIATRIVAGYIAGDLRRAQKLQRSFSDDDVFLRMNRAGDDFASRIDDDAVAG